MRPCPCDKTTGRPPKEATQVERLTRDGWVSDDGKPGLAFSGLVGYTPRAWYGPQPCYELDCPAHRALRRTCERFGAANGATLQ
jgi:hypothetical protein